MTALTHFVALCLALLLALSIFHACRVVQGFRDLSRASETADARLALYVRGGAL